jgi:hypothetical protein
MAGLNPLGAAVPPAVAVDPVVANMRRALQTGTAPALAKAALLGAASPAGAAPLPSPSTPPPPPVRTAAPPQPQPQPQPPLQPASAAVESASEALSRREARAAARAALRASAGSTPASPSAASSSPARAPVPTTSAPPRMSLLSDAELARERERWGQGSWRREHLRTEDVGTRDARAAWEDAQMEAQRAAGEAKLAALRKARGEEVEAPLPANVARRGGTGGTGGDGHTGEEEMAPGVALGARAQAAAAKAAKAAAAADKAREASAASAARDASAAALAASATAKATASSAAAERSSPMAQAFAALEAEAEAVALAAAAAAASAATVPKAPQAPAAAASAASDAAAHTPPPPLPPAPAAVRSARGGGYDDLRRRREAEAERARESAAGTPRGAAAFSASAALRAELEAEEARQRAALDAQRSADSEGARTRPLCNAPALAARSDTALAVAWTVAPAAPGEPPPEVAYYQLQVRPPGARSWANVACDAPAPRFEVRGLIPGTGYTLRVRARGGGAAGEWGPYSAPALCATSGARPHDAPREAFALSDDDDDGDGAPGSGGAYYFTGGAQHAYAPWDEAAAAQHAAPGGPLPPLPALPALRPGMSVAERTAALEEALRTVGAAVKAVAAAGLPAGEVRRALRQLRARYHPDKAAAEERWLYEELSKAVNAQAAALADA